MLLMSESVTNKIINLLEKRGPVHLDADMDFFYIDEGHVDSVSFIHFILELEEVFNITFNPEETSSEEFRSLKELTQLVNRKL
jgi:acyl carrier protein